MNIWNGSADPKTKVLRKDLRRPSKLELTSQSGQTTTIDLDDIHDRQVRYVDLSGVEALTIKILQTNGPSGRARVPVRDRIPQEGVTGVGSAIPRSASTAAYVAPVPDGGP